MEGQALVTKTIYALIKLALLLFGRCPRVSSLQWLRKDEVREREREGRKREGEREVKR